MNPHNLKQLQTREAKLLAEVESLKLEEEETKKKRVEAANKLKTIKDKLKEQKEIVISEHAMLRYIERELNIDLNEIKERILTDRLINSIQTCGNGKYPIGNAKAVVKNNIIVTII